MHERELYRQERGPNLPWAARSWDLAVGGGELPHPGVTLVCVCVCVGEEKIEETEEGRLLKTLYQ